MAGRVRLAITGIQDQWLTGEPQFSYFVMNYRRHTRFAIESKESGFDGQTSFGQTITCRIPNNIGDLVRSTTLKVTLEPLEQENEEEIRLYNTSIGSRIIEYADLLIGGQTIERITGEYIYIYDQIHNNKDDVEQTLYFLNGHGEHIGFSQPYTFYINLPFYFFRHPSLAIPLCAITKQLVEVRITFKPKNYKIAYNFVTFNDKYAAYNINAGEILSASLITDFYFITDDEKNFLKTRPIEYVITQLQLSTLNIKRNTITNSGLLKFQHPVKELYFVAIKDESRSYIPSLVSRPFHSDHKIIKRVALEFNGSTVFDQNGTYLAYEQSLKHHTGCPSPDNEFYMYSFALKPEVYFPTGQVNMSRIIHKKLTVELNEPDTNNDTHVNIYAVNYNVLRIESGLAGLKF